MDKLSFNQACAQYVHRYTSGNDKPALRQAWNDTIDAMCKANELPDRARDWRHPKRFYQYGSKQNPKRASGYKKGIKTIDITAWEWVDKAAGNSYFAANVIVNNGLPGMQSFSIPFQYGYDDHYKSIAMREMIKRGLVKVDDYTPLWSYCKEHKIVLRCNKYTGCKKRELMQLSAN